MNDYTAVRSSREISKHIVDHLELIEPVNFPPSDRARTVRSINDTLQGRGACSLDQLMSELELTIGRYDPTIFESIRHQIRDFQRQKALLTHRYQKYSDKMPTLALHVSGNRRLKVVGQRDYDACVRAGFPTDFFRQSFFDHVTLYCLPDGADFSGSTLQDCEFAVCGIQNTSFQTARIYSTQFHSSVLRETNFGHASLSYTHFHDCDLAEVSFAGAYLKCSGLIDCTLRCAQFDHAALDGCSFSRVRSSKISGLDTTKITQGGATEEECRTNRDAVLWALHGGGMTDGV